MPVERKQKEMKQEAARYIQIGNGNQGIKKNTNWKVITSHPEDAEHVVRNRTVGSVGSYRRSLSFENDLSKDSERIRILISMTVWTIWKSRNKNSINDQDVSQAETRETLRELIRDMIRKSWNATRFLVDSKKRTRRRALRVLWAHGHFTKLDPRSNPTFDFS